MTASELPRHHPLRRTKPMPRGDNQLRRTAMKPYRPTITAEQRAAHDLVEERAGGWCEIRIDGTCLGRGTDWHHRKLRSRGGGNEASNGLWLCRACHSTITNTNGHLAEYEAQGWIVASHDDPAAVPVLLHNATVGHDWVLLDDQGDLAFAPYPVPAAGDPFDLPAPPRGTSAAPDTAA